MNIYDVAKKAGVSIATVSRVINGSAAVNEQTRDKVKQVMENSGYTPNVFARGLMKNSMKTLGVMTVDVRDPYYASAIHIIELETRANGYNVMLCCTGEDLKDKRKYLEFLLQKRVDGIFLVGSVFKEQTDNRHIIEAARQAPVVMINGYLEGDNIYSVLCDDTRAIASTVNYLFEKGRRELVYIYDTETFSGSAKLEGFKNGMAEKGVAVDSDMVIKTAKGISGGYQATDLLLTKGIKFSAIVTSDDLLAVGVLKRLRQAGLRIPQDVAVAGFNNSVIAECTNPGLTSVDSKVEALTSRAVKMMLDVLEGGNIPPKTIVSPELVIRDTT